jgi:hypothetical protein
VSRDTQVRVHSMRQIYRVVEKLLVSQEGLSAVYVASYIISYVAKFFVLLGYYAASMVFNGVSGHPIGLILKGQ